jgi:IS4 transposase
MARRFSPSSWTFKWIKQHLRIKQFFGTSENAVKTQIWIAVSVYVLVAIVKKCLKLEASSTHCSRTSRSRFSRNYR